MEIKSNTSSNRLIKAKFDELLQIAKEIGKKTIQPFSGAEPITQQDKSAFFKYYATLTKGITDETELAHLEKSSSIPEK